ncbi:MAG: hypothetical protein ACLQBY_12500 [Solirubrobacteraceae bacterium]
MLGLASGAVLAISAITAAGSALAARLTLTDHGEVLHPGYRFEIYGDLPEDFSFETSDGGGLYECEGAREQDQVYLEVVSNSQPTDELKILSVEYGGNGIQCVGSTTIRGGRAFPYIYEGGSIKLRASGRATMPLTLGIEYEAREEEPRCFYPSRKKPASNNATTSPQPLDISFSHELRVERADSGKTCPKRAGLQMSLAHTYDYEGEEELIDEQVTSSR